MMTSNNPTPRTEGRIVVGGQEIEKDRVCPLYKSRLERRVVGLLKNEGGVLLSYCACGDIGDRARYDWRTVDMSQEADFSLVE